MQRTATHSQTNEQALEAAIEVALTGTSLEKLKDLGVTTDVAEAAVPYRSGSKFYLGEPQDFDAQLAIDTRRLWHFLETTQGKELDKLKVQADWRKTLLHRLDKMIQRYGTLYVLRKGLDVADAHFTLFYSVPLASSSAEVWARFEQNEFSVTRQVRYNTLKPGEEIDLVIFINGLPIITSELKNAWTGQTARVNGIHQYKTGRDAAQPLLQFGRCLVHFAADTEEVWMTTKLAGSATVFLPFNKGHKEGAGNPPNDSGHRTAYLWKEVLTRYSLGEIIEHFVTLEGKPADPLAKRNLLFPRYHQLDVVRRLIGDAAQKGVGQTYLIQHSAGSGKSNSITWAAYRLIELYPSTDSIPGSKGLTEPLFDSVIVVTDRRVLDRQLKDNIREFAQVRNIVAHATTSGELKAALESGKKIIITTIQKFPHIVSGIADLSDKRFAVIIDEAHSSQSGSAADNMNRAMGKREEDEDERDAQDLILEAMRSRKMRGNASYFAFTATPKPTTLEKFGEAQADGSFKPFHLYSMKQAIEEGFILDVLANYTTYRSYYEIEKSIEDNPLFDTVRAQKKLKAFVERHEQTIATKAEIMLEHFLSHVVAPKKLKGKAKGMVVTQSIESAIQYYFAIKKLLAEKSNPFKIVIAFSGKKLVKGQEYTEESLNGFSSADIKDQFDTDEYRLLVVANKFLTGFDQPKLTAMYVDKKLQGVLAVQALSRLNRSAPWLGKKTEDLFVLDFFNEVEDIKTAFDDFYTATTLSRATDVNVLHELMGQLELVGVYEWSEVEEFVAGYFAGVDAQELSPIIQTAAERFNNELELEDNEKADFKIKAKHFVKVYGQMAALLPYEVVRWEKLFWFLKFLIPHLLITDPVAGAIDELLDSVDLSTYGLERTKLGHSIVLDPAEAELDPANPNPRGAHGGDAEEDPLDIIVRSFNERWFTGWDATPEEQRVKFVALARHVQEHPNFQSQYVNNPDVQNRELAFSKIVADAINKQRRTDLDLYRLFAQDESFRQAMLQAMRRIVGG
ncbi:type I restriction enzyme, R subunit [Cnuella takakiae]|uniref:Type I restriction enzyme, R subunit n=1 Tax=Cnuella takakiae TaxID=1302690 RepID=A0A1M4TAW8_9BACT|nr:type I restriction endonuclease subunit R [Cnuella takakiae]OLY94592.1 DEAD/DEAH box helicase [Cnuella takakiae]SHE41689.1 type I restriction enzyme, R subunit [Cnuella takakiae]